MRGPDDFRDRSSRPHELPWKASGEERAVVCALRRATGFPLDDLTFVVRHFLPHLGRDHVYRILKAEGLSRRPAPAAPERPAGKFKEYELGFVHVDVKHLPKPRTADGELRERFLFVAIDRRSRSVHLAVEDEETEAAAEAFLEEAVAAFPFRVTHILTDRGSCFTAEGFERRCRELGIEHRKTRPYTPGGFYREVRIPNLPKGLHLGGAFWPGPTASSTSMNAAPSSVWSRPAPRSARSPSGSAATRPRSTASSAATASATATAASAATSP